MSPKPHAIAEVQQEHLTHQCNAGARKVPLCEASTGMPQRVRLNEIGGLTTKNIKKTWI